LYIQNPTHKQKNWAKQLHLTFGSQKLLKILHIYFGGIWCGGAASLFAIHCLYFPNSGPELYARNMSLIFIDYFIIIPAAIGSCVTGVLYSQMTKWGYLRYHWVIVKWVCTIFFIIIGFIWFVPWLNEMVEVTKPLRDNPVIDYSRYDVSTYIHMGMTVLQTVLLLFLVIISVLKPWGRTNYRW
jgi:hypothetical protein